MIDVVALVQTVAPRLQEAVAVNRALILGVMGLMTAIIAGLFALARSRPSAAVKAQDALNGTMETLAKSLADRIKVLELQHESCVQQYRALEQHLISLEDYLRRHGFDVPKRPMAEIVLFLDTGTGGRHDG